MAKKTTKKTAPKGASKGGTATLEPGKDQKQVELLPKGQTRAKDGTIILGLGEHSKLTKATYEVHGSRLELRGDVFIAQYDADWIPVKKCSCKVKRPGPVTIQKLQDGKWAASGTCNSKTCQYAGKRYLRILPQERLRLV